MDKIKSKRGHIEIVFITMIFIFFIFIFFSVYLLYSKININIYKVKQDLPYILQNAIIAFDKKELAYNNFKVDEHRLFEVINNLINLNYNNVDLNYISYNKEQNKIDVIVEVDLNLDKWNIKEKILLSDSIDFKMMEINNENM